MRFLKRKENKNWLNSQLHIKKGFLLIMEVHDLMLKRLMMQMFNYAFLLYGICNNPITKVSPLKNIDWPTHSQLSLICAPCRI